MRYEIYFEGCSNPVYTYHVYGWMTRRFQLIANLGSITNVTVKEYRPGKMVRTYRVWFGKDVMGNRIWEA